MPAICLSVYLPILHKTSHLTVVVHNCCAWVPGTTETTEAKLTKTSASCAIKTAIKTGCLWRWACLSVLLKRGKDSLTPGSGSGSGSLVDRAPEMRHHIDGVHDYGATLFILSAKLLCVLERIFIILCWGLYQLITRMNLTRSMENLSCWSRHKITILCWPSSSVDFCMNMVYSVLHIMQLLWYRTNCWLMKVMHSDITSEFLATCICV